MSYGIAILCRCTLNSQTLRNIIPSYDGVNNKRMEVGGADSDPIPFDSKIKAPLQAASTSNQLLGTPELQLQLDVYIKSRSCGL